MLACLTSPREWTRGSTMMKRMACMTSRGARRAAWPIPFTGERKKYCRSYYNVLVGFNPLRLHNVACNYAK